MAKGLARLKASVALGDQAVFVAMGERVCIADPEARFAPARARARPRAPWLAGEQFQESRLMTCLPAWISF
ncbi:MAG: hypothetical protein J0H01_35955 [Rhizobiales bacterium]|nr:hypothetical protein [Hyphomicrobiales bacterium]